MSMRRLHHRPGFTLIELLVVAAIIAVLVGLLTGVGVVVVRNQQSGATKNVLVALDRCLDEYMLTSSGAPPKFRIEDYYETPGPNATELNPVYFGVYESVRYPIRPDAVVFLRQVWGVGQVQGIVAGLGERFLRVTTTRSGESPNQSSIAGRDAEVFPTVVDVWSRGEWAAPWDLVQSFGGGNVENLEQVILYVHPSNLLAQELYGKCVNNRPYFVSAGPDRLYGLKNEFGNGAPKDTVEAALADNVYSYEVGPANTTSDFFSMHR